MKVVPDMTTILHMKVDSGLFKGVVNRLSKHTLYVMIGTVRGKKGHKLVRIVLSVYVTNSIVQQTSSIHMQ